MAVVSPQGLYLHEFIGQKGVERELSQIEAERGAFGAGEVSPTIDQLVHELAEDFAGSRTSFGVRWIGWVRPRRHPLRPGPQLR